jgi:Uma2 family endonuclease
MSAVLDLPRRALTVDEYHRMAEAGVFAPDERVELIEGELIPMAPIGGGHIQAVNRLNRILVIAAGDAAVVSVQNALALPPRSEPQPDLVLLRPETLARPVVPTAADALLAIEVSDTRLAFDRDVKSVLYARHQVPEYWLVDLARKVVRVYRSPGPDSYREMFERGAGERLASLAFPHVEVDLNALFA